MSAQRYRNQSPADLSSSEMYDIVTPSNSVMLPYQTRQITVGTPGDLSLVRPDGVTVVIPEAVITAQPVQDIAAIKVNATGTSASDIFAKY